MTQKATMSKTAGSLLVHLVEKSDWAGGFSIGYNKREIKALRELEAMGLIKVERILAGTKIAKGRLSSNAE
jgi:hypothetical protein